MSVVRYTRLGYRAVCTSQCRTAVVRYILDADPRTLVRVSVYRGTHLTSVTGLKSRVSNRLNPFFSHSNACCCCCTGSSCREAICICMCVRKPCAYTRGCINIPSVPYPQIETREPEARANISSKKLSTRFSIQTSPSVNYKLMAKCALKSHPRRRPNQ